VKGIGLEAGQYWAKARKQTIALTAFCIHDVRSKEHAALVIKAETGSKLEDHVLLLVDTFVEFSGGAVDPVVVHAAMAEAVGHGAVNTLQGRVDSDVIRVGIKDPGVAIHCIFRLPLAKGSLGKMDWNDGLKSELRCWFGKWRETQRDDFKAEEPG
jgi:hypothetical protein